MKVVQSPIAHVCLAACLAVVGWPVWDVDWPPIFDYPNHLARAHVIAALDTSSVFGAHFRLTSFLIPNVLADLLVLALLPFTGVLLAGKVLLLFTFALTLTGAYALNKVLTGAYSPWPLLVAALLYNEGFFWGFLNYNLGLGLLLWGLVMWAMLEGRTPGERFVIGSCFASLIFLAHLVAFGLYAVGVMVLEARRIARDWRGLGTVVERLGPAAAQFIVPLIVFLSLSPSGDLGFFARFDFSIPGKIMPFARILSSGNPTLDFMTLGAVVGVVVAALLANVAVCEGALLLLAAVYLVLVLTLPFSMLGSFFLDSRIVIAVALVFVTGLKSTGQGRPGVVATLVTAIVIVRSIGLVWDWRFQDRDTADVIATLDRVPPGSVIVTVVGHPFELGDWIITRRVKPSHEHTTLYATIRNDVLVPNIFARRGQNPLVLESSLDELNRVARNPVARIFHPGDARWLVAEVMALANARDRASPVIPAVYVVGYHVPCPWWPVDMPIRPVHCAPTYSLIEVLGDVGEVTP